SPVPARVLMRRAGVGAAHVAIDTFGIQYGSRVHVLVGPGDNGGDGYVVADVLAKRGAEVSLSVLGPPKSEAAKFHAARTATLTRRECDDPDLIVDAVTGTASRAGLPDDVARWGDGRAPILSLD